MEFGFFLTTNQALTTNYQLLKKCLPLHRQTAILLHMITVSNIAVQFGKRTLFDEVNLKFTRGNCYGIIGANGAGKSTFMKVMTGDMDATRGDIGIEPGNRMAVLRQNHYEFNEFTVLNTVIMGHKQLYDIMVERDAIYAKEDASEEDNLRAAYLEGDFAEMNGWMAESDAAELLSNLGIREDLHYLQLKELSGNEKVKVLLAQALFGNPDILMMDEPTNDLDSETIDWLCDFLADYQNLVLVISHDRHFLDMICTHMVDVDFGRIRMFAGNYTFWYETSQLLLRQMADKNKKVETRRAELQDFIARFSANASKAKQATSRKKALEKLNLDEIKPSSRKYPFIHFKPERDPGDVVIDVVGLAKSNNSGEVLFSNINFNINRNEKIGIVSRNPMALVSFMKIIAGEEEADAGTYRYGQTITPGYLPSDNTEYFMGDQQVNLIDWLRQYSKEKDEQFIRGFLGRMLFSGEESFKNVSVLSGGEKVRCMLSKVMLESPNFLIIDEPVNHLDLESITAFNNALIDFKGNMIFHSHDIHIMNTVANRIIELTPTGMIDKLCTYEEFLHDPRVKEQREEMYLVNG
jgi:ATPase subunit of ABC transporter with duplicated ATPase domains